MAGASTRPWPPNWPRPRATPGARLLVDRGLVAPHWPAPWGRNAGAVEQVVVDEVLAAAGVQRPHLGIGAWVLPVLHRVRHAGPAGALGPSHAAGRALVVPALLRTGRGVGPGRAVDAGRAGRRWLVADRPEGLDLDGPPVPVGDLPGPDRPRRPQARRHHLLHRRHDVGRTRRASPARADRGGAVQRGLLRRRVRARRLRGRGGAPRLGHRPDDAGQRAGLDLLGRHVRHRGRVAGPPGGAPGRRGAASPPRCDWAPCWPRRSPCRS